MPDKTDEKQRKFIKGKSGNPLGRPRGVRNRATVLAEKLFKNETERFVGKPLNWLQKEKTGNIVISENVSGMCRSQDSFRTFKEFDWGSIDKQLLAINF